MTNLVALQRRHRLEEIASRFGVRLAALGDDLTLPFSELADVRIDGRLLDAGRAAHRAEMAGLTYDDHGIQLPLSDEPDIDALEDSLLALLGGLLEAAPDYFLGPPRPGVHVPSSGELPESKALLERFYGNDFVPREKKAAVVDLQRCQGPYLRSVDRDPLQIVDSASQIASLAAGFRPDAVQAALDDGRLDPHLIDAHADVAPDLELLRFVAPGLQHVCYTNAGAEAVEKALHLARRFGGGGKRVIAFEGSFHGRTLLSLYSTWNPVKRAPYQLEGFETEFVKFPAVSEPGTDPPCPADWREQWSQRDGRRDWDPADKPVFSSEIAALLAVEAQLRAGDVMAVICEPYQCEGGDRAATSRFFHGLRALTRAWGTPLIFDEVQAGFGLSGSFFWHRHFWLIDAKGKPDGPDLVVCAKRAQTGVVLSRWPDPYPTDVHSCSRVRGRIHRQVVYPSLTLTAHVRVKLRELAAAFPPGLITRERATGDAFAFDLPSKTVANKVIAQRFYRGMMVYIAGEKTLRYRLNRAMTVAHVDEIFASIAAALGALLSWTADGASALLFDRMAETEVPAWVAPEPAEPPTPIPGIAAVLADRTGGRADRVLKATGQLTEQDRFACCAAAGLPSDARGSSAVDAMKNVEHSIFEAKTGVPFVHFAADVLGTRIRGVPAADFDAWMSDVKMLENDAYEPARQDAISYLRTVAELDGGIMLVAEDPRGMVGMSFSGPLELWWGIDGPRQDPNLGRDNTLYSADITVASRARGRGVGYRLRVAQLRAALAQRTADGAPRYAFVTGRNRVGEADAMWAINRKVGAYTVAEYTDQYSEANGRARYYRIPLRRWDRRAFSPDDGAQRLLGRARDLGVFDEPALTKLTMSNFITAGWVRYCETMQAMAPRGTAHMYFTSSRDEMVDKAVRLLKHKRKASRLPIGFSGGYFGHTTAAARSLTDWSAFHGADPDAFRQPPDEGYFGWPRVSSVSDLDALVEEHGADALIGVFVEAVQERTGRTLTGEQWSELCAFRDRTGVPLVLSETTTGGYRSGHGAWWLDSVSGDPDVVMWFAGGQLGHLFCSDAVYVDKPLSFISTWDGDELSATRNLWCLWAAQQADPAAMGKRLADGIEAAGYKVAGTGLYRMVICSESELDRVVDRLGRVEVPNRWFERIGPTRLAVKPPVWADPHDIDRVLQALREARR